MNYLWEKYATNRPFKQLFIKLQKLMFITEVHFLPSAS